MPKASPPVSSDCFSPCSSDAGSSSSSGAGAGRLTKRLVDAGHDVIATDASPSMLELATRRRNETLPAGLRAIIAVKR